MALANLRYINALNNNNNNNNIVMSMYVVCLFVCLFSGTHMSTSNLNQTFCACYLWLWLDFFPGGIAICYILPVLWMTLCF